MSAPSGLRGQAAAPGAALGPAWRLDALEPGGAPETAEDAAVGARRGLGLAIEELDLLGVRLREQGLQEEAEIVEANRLMAEDPGLLEGIEAAASAGTAPADAIRQGVEPYAALLEALPDETLAARAADLRALARRGGELATGCTREPPQGAVLVARDVGPADVASWAPRLGGIVLAAGGHTSHAAIVARSLGLPLVTGAGDALTAIADGDEVGVDGSAGRIWLQPAAPVRRALRRQIDATAAARARDRGDRALEAVTTDGARVRLLANAGTPEEVAAAMDAGAEGVGLLRSELAFLASTAWPGEDEHAAVLRPMLELLEGRLATVRTLDFGGDKTPPFLAASQGASGLLAPRGIRLTPPAALEAQLRGLLRSAGGSRLRILVPMVSEPAELELVRELAGRARDAVAPSAELVIGAMVEVPAAAMAADGLAAVADFLSIGTNDLVQYTLAADRLHPAHAERVSAAHPAVLRLVAGVVRAAHERGIPVDVCGEAAGDPDFLPLLVALGVDELSVSPARIAGTRRLVRQLSRARAGELLETALAARSAAEVAAAARAALG